MHTLKKIIFPGSPGATPKSVLMTLVLECMLCSIEAAAQELPDTLSVAGKKGTSYPGFRLRNGEGELTSDQLRGKVIWINFWFEACKPCMAEMGAIDDVVRSLRNREDFVMLSLTWDDQQAIRRVREKFPMPYPVYSVSEETCARLNGGRGYPTNVVIDKQGLIRYIAVGGKTDPDQAREDIRQQILPVITEALQ
jgi:thiol-disulfide isomerase/thioredoxin